MAQAAGVTHIPVRSDAIRKGLAAQGPQAPWEVPYLPIDPADLGRSYDKLIRVNSQSGKGGMAYLLERDHGVVMPRRMQVEFSAVVQAHADSAETEITSAELWRLFEATYLRPTSELIYAGHHLFEAPGGAQGIALELLAGDRRLILRGSGVGPIAAAVNALGVALRIDSYEERSLGKGASALAMAIVEAARSGAGSRFGVGIHANIVTASVLAVLSAALRLGVTSEDLPHRPSISTLRA